MPRFTISIEQRQLELVTIYTIFSVVVGSPLFIDHAQKSSRTLLQSK